jgi:hypothetical protein
VYPACQRCILSAEAVNKERRPFPVAVLVSFQSNYIEFQSVLFVVIGLILVLLL